MAGSGLPVPALIASDALGTEAGGSANLTSWPRVGSGWTRRGGPPSTSWPARQRSSMPRRSRPVSSRRTTSSGPRLSLEVPAWSAVPHLWRRAIEIFGQPPPLTTPGLVHRDFHPGNILWAGDRITGVIDWAETSWGPPDLDVAHAMTNFAMLHDLDSADAFALAYRRHGGVVEEDPDAARFWSVSDILGFLPDPALHLTALIKARPELDPTVLRFRLDQLLSSILDQLGATAASR